MAIGKAFQKMDREELENAVDQKTALPDMVLKRQYFQAQESMTLAEAKLMFGFFQNDGFYNELDVYRFRSAILGVFRPISGMIEEAKVWNWIAIESPLVLAKNRVKTDYDLCLKLTNYAPLDVSTLIHLAGYLHFCLHRLGLTNLLLDTSDGEYDIAKIV